VKKILAIAAIGFFLIGMLVLFAQALPRVEINQLKKLDHLTIRSFSCKIGNLIPRSHWEAHYPVS